MLTTRGQIDSWRQSPSEHQRLEFKEAKAQLDNHKLHECVALANEVGGFLVLGVADKPPRPVVGTQAFRDPMVMTQKLFQAVGFRVDSEEVSHPDGRVLVFHECGLDQAGRGGRKLAEVRALAAVLGMNSFKRLPVSGRRDRLHGSNPARRPI